MSTQVITTKQAKSQVNHFGRALIIYIVVLTVYRYGMHFVESQFPQLFSLADSRLVTQIGISLALIIASFIPFSIAAACLHLKMGEYYKKTKVGLGNYVSLTALGLGVYLIATSLMTIMGFFVKTKSYIDLTFIGDFRTWPLAYINIAYFVYMVIVKPICDEFVFRGVIQRQLGHYGRYFGVLASAVLYALAQGNLAEAIPAFMLGWFLSLVTLKYHSLIPTMIVQIAVSFFFWGISVIPSNLYMIVPIVIIIVYILVAFAIFKKRIHKQMSYAGAANKELWKIVFTSSTIIICIIIFIANVVLSFII